MNTRRDDKLKAWVDQTLELAVYELLDAGIAESLLVEAKPAWMLPYQILIGKIREQGDSSGFSWFISGDIPTDHADSGAALSAREAARYFALRWQLHAARGESGHEGLSEKAEALYQLTEDDDLWSPA